MVSLRIKDLRKENRMTQEDLAKKIKTTKATISNYETGYSRPDLDALTNLAEVFDVSIDYLMGKSNIKKPYDENRLPDKFETPEEAVKFILEDNTIMRFGGFDINKFTYEEKVEFANELLNHIKFLAFKRNEAKNK